MVKVMDSVDRVVDSVCKLEMLSEFVLNAGLSKIVSFPVNRLQENLLTTVKSGR